MPGVVGPVGAHASTLGLVKRSTVNVSALEMTCQNAPVQTAMALNLENEFVAMVNFYLPYSGYTLFSLRVNAL